MNFMVLLTDGAKEIPVAVLNAKDAVDAVTSTQEFARDTPSLHWTSIVMYRELQPSDRCTYQI